MKLKQELKPLKVEYERVSLRDGSPAIKGYIKCNYFNGKEWSPQLVVHKTVMIGPKMEGKDARKIIEQMLWEAITMMLKTGKTLTQEPEPVMAIASAPIVWVEQ